MSQRNGGDLVNNESTGRHRDVINLWQKGTFASDENWC